MYCSWANDALLIAYHDNEWGVRPETDSGWFELITLETFQAGLSWKTILHKRLAFREGFKGFVVESVAGYTDHDVSVLLEDSRIVRNRRKITAAVENARVALNLIEKFGSMDNYFRQLSTLTTKNLLEELQTTFSAVGKITAESIAYASGLIGPPHEATCWKYDASGSQEERR